MQKNNWFGMRADENDLEQIKTLSKLLGLTNSQAVRLAITHALNRVPEILEGLTQEQNNRGAANVTD